MKIMVLGYIGSGKSTLSRRLGEVYGVDVFHCDPIFFPPDRPPLNNKEKARLIEEYLETHDSWVIDGDYFGTLFERRLEEADRIVVLMRRWVTCMYRRFWRRYGSCRDTISRPIVAKGMKQKRSWKETVNLWVGGHKRQTRERYQHVIDSYGDKVVVIRNQRQMDAFLASLPAASTRQKSFEQ